MLALQHNISALRSVFRFSLWLPLWLLPGLFSMCFASANVANKTLQSTYQIPHNKTLIQQRKLFQQAQSAFKAKQYKRFERLSDKLETYPLHAYLEYKSLLRNPSSLNDKQIDHFLLSNDNTVIGDRFRSKFIKLSAKQHNWRRLIKLYRADYGVSAQCNYLNALIHTQQTELAYPQIKRLWLSAKSRPKSCDIPFENWQRAGKKTPELVWQRFTLAMSVSNQKLARYLIKSMPVKDAHTARTWLKVHKKPTLIHSSQVSKLPLSKRLPIIVHGLKRLTYRDTDKAIESYAQLSHLPFSHQQKAVIVRHIGLYLARSHMPNANEWLSRVPTSHTNKHVKEWQIRTAIRQGNWLTVKQKINALELQHQASYRWQYWWAYANKQLGNINDAHGIFQYLALKRSYYGFLAADHLNQAYAFADKPVEDNAELMALVSSKNETIRAHEFYIMGDIVPARREWHRLIKKLNRSQKLLASKLAQSWQWHDRAIVTMGKTDYRDDITLRFPLHLNDKVYAWSSQRNIDPAWTYAIIRRESAFMLDARSSVGALGLMQLMPNTARYVAKSLNIRYKGKYSLLSSNTNICLGTGYLESMLNQLSHQQVLATAAYNAGPHRVKKWLPEHQQMDAIRWIETIPFTETREYVSNVLAYMAIYEHRMNRKITRLSHRMPPIPAKNPRIITLSGDNKPVSPPIKTASKKPS